MENFPQRKNRPYGEFSGGGVRRLERIERVKAEERMKAGKPLDPMHNCVGGIASEIVAEKRHRCRI